MIKRIHIRIRHDQRSNVAALLIMAVLVAVFLAYLLWGQTGVAASAAQPAPSLRVAQATATGEMRQYYLTPSSAFNGAQADQACAAGYHMASVWELADISNLQYNRALGRTQGDSGHGPPSYVEGWVHTGYNQSTANTVGHANCDAWFSASSGDYGTSLYLPRDWLTGQDLSTWKTGTWPCSTNMPVWCIADQAVVRQYYLTASDAYLGSQPTTVCATGYHMASLWEILDPSNMRYNVNMGYQRLDAGMGPPTATFGWVRTGYDSDDGSVSGAGQANCSAWASGSAGHYGSVVRLPEDWTTPGQHDLFVWNAGLRQCNDGAPAWCVADEVDGRGTCAVPQPIYCGQQVNGNTTGYASHHLLYDCQPSWSESGPEVVYGLTLPDYFAPYDVTATLSYWSADVDVFILPAGGCHAGTCLSPTSYGNTEATASGLAAGTYYVVVDGYNGAVASYTLSVDCGYNAVHAPMVLRGFTP